jgi:acyl carrier protein
VNDNTLDQVRTLVADVLGLSADTVGSESSQQTLPGWDSLQHLNIALSVESRFGLSLSPAEIERIRSVPAILQLLESKRAAV